MKNQRDIHLNITKEMFDGIVTQQKQSLKKVLTDPLFMLLANKMGQEVGEPDMAIQLQRNFNKMFGKTPK